MASNTMNFNNVSDITFTKTNSEIKIFVSGSLLGAINTNNPVTVFTAINGSAKTITIQDIGLSAFNLGNTNNPLTDTIQLRHTKANLILEVDCCQSVNTRHKIIGWETDTIGQICVGGKGSDAYYDISSPGNFKAMIMSIGTEPMMVARYSSAVNNPYSGSAPLCDTALYCYICRV